MWPDFREQHAFVSAVVERAQTLPGVTAAAIAGNHPLDPGFTNSFQIVGRESEAREAGWPELTVRRVTAGYFSTVGLQLQRGRLLTSSDGTSSTPVLLINDAAARRFFGERDPLGAQIRMYGIPRTIVGVVANERSRGLNETAPLATYLPLAQAPSVDGAGVLLVRTAADPLGVAPSLRDVIRERCSGSNHSIALCRDPSPNDGSRWCSSGSSRLWRSCSGRLGCTVCSATTSPAACAKSGSGWRSGRNAARCCG
jgi:hypothetical protein